MNFPYLLSVWQPSLDAAHQFINQHALGNNLVQLEADSEMKFAYWCVLRVTGDQMVAIQTTKTKPVLTCIPKSSQ